MYTKRFESKERRGGTKRAGEYVREERLLTKNNNNNNMDAFECGRTQLYNTLPSFASNIHQGTAPCFFSVVVLFAKIILNAAAFFCRWRCYCCCCCNVLFKFLQILPVL